MTVSSHSLTNLVHPVLTSEPELNPNCPPLSSAPDIDIDNEELTVGNYYSTAEDMANTLRWIGIMNGNVDCDLCASTGIHNGKDIIKFLLAGASTVQMVSSVYMNGSIAVTEALEEINSWMEKKGYDSIDKFRGNLSKSTGMNSTLYERVQFMKYFGTHKK